MPGFKQSKYLIMCKYCGVILLKTENPIISVFKIEIKCPNPNCKRILRLPMDAIINLEKKRRRGLDKGSGIT